MDDRDRETRRDTDRTTIVHTDGSRGSGGALVAVAVLVVLVVVLFLLFGGNLGRSAQEGDINVNVAAPDVQVPDVNIELPDTAEPEGGANNN